MLTLDEEHLLYNDARQTTERGNSLAHRDLRPQHISPEKPYEKPKVSKSAEPNEMLWIGFPAAFMNVSEADLRSAFSPFGEIDKISTFPGRTFAFVRFKTIVAACNAKEALQGRLFNNPRVSICFAQNDSTADQLRGPGSGSLPLQVRSSYHPGLSGQDAGEIFQREKNFENRFGEFHMASPGYMSNLDRASGDHSITGLSRNTYIRTSAPGSVFGGTFEHGRLQELVPERRMSDDSFERHRDSPAADRSASWLDSSFGRVQKAPPLEDHWGPESGSFSLSKRLKADPSPDNELPEYPFLEFKQVKRPGLPEPFPGLPDQPTYTKHLDSVPFGFKAYPELSRTVAHPITESNDTWESFGAPSAAPGSSLQKFNSEPSQTPVSKEWKWEGTIAKGGTAICRARCFPVGKVMDFMLPEILDCTSKTGIDMLAKHYSQEASSWVVFFVPETDADISSYNEFLHYLGDKQRAVVAKIGEKVSLFLVPPSDFSEQVLKVPGTVSISGVIIRFQQPSSRFRSFNGQMEAMEARTPTLVSQPSSGTTFHSDVSFPRPNSPDYRPLSESRSIFGSSSGLATPGLCSFLPPHEPGDNLLPWDKSPYLHKENIQDQFQHQNPSFPSNHWSNSTPLPIHNSGGFPSAPNAAPLDIPKMDEYPHISPRVAQGIASSNYMREGSSVAPLPFGDFFRQQQEPKPLGTSSMQLPLHPDQLAHLAAFLGQLGNPISQSGDNRQSRLPQNTSSQDQTALSHPQVFPQAPQVSMGSQISRSQQLQQQIPSASVIQQPTENPVQLSGQQATSSSQEESEADPQKRIQATIQLAAALQQQIQQQAPSSSQEESEAGSQKRLHATLQLAAALLQQIQQQAKT